MNISTKLNNLLFPLSNCESVVIQLFRHLHVHVSKGSITKQLEEHPDFPSLLSVSEVLNNFGVDNLSTNIPIEKIEKLPVPMIVQVELGKDKLFSVVTHASGNTIKYIDPITNSEILSTIDEFGKIFTGYVLIGEASESSGEKEFRKNNYADRRNSLARILTATSLPALTILLCICSFSGNGSSSLPAIFFTLLTLAGTIVGALLIWYEIDKHNPALQQICSAGKKTNCNAILDSKASKIFGISWSVLGFTYFAGGLLSLLITNITHLPLLIILSWFNVLVLPYIGFSLYYQAKVAKQWCVLCLTTQAILALQFLVSLWGGFHSAEVFDNLTNTNIVVLLVAYLIPFLAVSLFVPALRMAKDSRKNKTELQRLKHNTQVFEALLQKQKRISEPNGLGIQIGNPNALHKIVKVCNPYCDPCAKAHPAMEELIHNNPDVQIQIVFTATGKDDDYKTPPTRHLLAIAEKGDETLTKQALDDWYLADKKNYPEFAVKYPMNGELKKQSEKMGAMKDWCDKTDIEFTPTFFVNGYQLPKMYSVSDLKYFLSV